MLRAAPPAQHELVLRYPGRKKPASAWFGAYPPHAVHSVWPYNHGPPARRRTRTPQENPRSAQATSTAQPLTVKPLPRGSAENGSRAGSSAGFASTVDTPGRITWQGHANG